MSTSRPGWQSDGLSGGVNHAFSVDIPQMMATRRNVQRANRRFAISRSLGGTTTSPGTPCLAMPSLKCRMNVTDYSDQSHDRKLNRSLGEKKWTRRHEAMREIMRTGSCFGRYPAIASCSSELRGSIVEGDHCLNLWNMGTYSNDAIDQ